MKKIYYDFVYKPENEEAKEYLLSLAKACTEASEKLSKETLGILMPELFRRLRVKMNLPYKVFGFATNKDKTEVVIVTYPKEPDGKYYEAYHDEENKPYILVEED